jgi:hypothetical protein
MTSIIDILDIDAQIKQRFGNDLKNLIVYKKKLNELTTTYNKSFPIRVKNNLDQNIHDLTQKIYKIETNEDQNFYIAETASFIEAYKSILQRPIVVNFIGKIQKNDHEKKTIIRSYTYVAQKYFDIVIEPFEKKNKIVCNNCKNKTKFDIKDDNLYICQECGTEKEVLLHAMSYKDIYRVNMSTKYSYDRIIHFRDCINQYQGKQNSTIDQTVYNNLEEEFRRHHLLLGNIKSPKEIRFSNIEKIHIFMFLKELSLTKHYENINLIHYNFTGIKPDNISYLEDILLNDFDVFTDVYDKLFKNKKQNQKNDSNEYFPFERTNFINTQYVLFQLLQRHKHKCKKEDFVMLKTIDKQAFHDYVTSKCFQALGWRMSPLF